MWYVERNPVRAKIVKKPWEWKYSSAKAHIGKDESCLHLVEQFFNYVDLNQKGWKKHIEEKDKEVDRDEIKKHTMSGRPLGKADFVVNLEKN